MNCEVVCGASDDFNHRGPGEIGSSRLVVHVRGALQRSFSYQAPN